MGETAKRCSVALACLAFVVLDARAASASASASAIFYVVQNNGELHWLRHAGAADGTPRWESKKVGTGWTMFRMFAGPNGVLYGIKKNGDLHWIRHDGFRDGSIRWSSSGASRKVGNGWAASAP